MILVSYNGLVHTTKLTKFKLIPDVFINKKLKSKASDKLLYCISNLFPHGLQGWGGPGPPYYSQNNEFKKIIKAYFF